MIGSLEKIRENLNRPINILDWGLRELDEDIPEDRDEYIDSITSSGKKRELIDWISNLHKDDKRVKEMQDEILRNNLLYAVKYSPFSDFFDKKYGKGLKTNNVPGFIRENIDSTEDLEHLPELNSKDIRKTNISGKIDRPISEIYQSGGSTGEPKYIPYSKIDDLANTIMYAGIIKEDIGIERPGKVLILAPPKPHPFGPIIEKSLKELDITPIWKHFAKGFDPKNVLKQIEETEPDLIIGAPSGPKGANATFENLIKVDEEQGSDIIENSLEGKNIISGGMPLPLELGEDLYDKGIRKIINGYGSVEISGGFEGSNKNIIKEKKDNGVNFFSDVKTPPNWIVNPGNDGPREWSSPVFTVLGREMLPIINYNQGDYAKVYPRELKDICRKDWFHEKKDGSYEVRIPSQVYTCISDV